MAEALARIQGFPAPAGPLDLVLHRGTVVRISGRNGSGKTSLLRNLAGLPAPLMARRTVLEGWEPASLPAPALARRLGVVHQDARDGLVGLTVAGEYRFRGRVPPPGAGRQDVATLSSGEARRLALSLARGPLLLLDEPTEGLDADGMAALRARIQQARPRACVVLVDHEGVLADLADVHIVLAAAVEEPPWELPAAGSAPRLEADAGEVSIGERTIRWPAVRLPPGLHAVTGRNGSGKSTFLRHLAGIPLLGGAAVRAAPPRHGEAASTAPRLRSTDDGALAAPLARSDVRWLSARAEDHLTRPTVDEELQLADALGVEDLVPADLLARHPLRLSGGERKRAALAKVLGSSAPVYLLDEPEAHLDADGRRALRDLVAMRIRQGSVVLAATHDPHLIAAAHSIVRLEGP